MSCVSGGVHQYKVQLVMRKPGQQQMQLVTRKPGQQELQLVMRKPLQQELGSTGVQQPWVAERAGLH